MNDKKLEKMIISTVDNLPIPWEKLWAIFQKIIQQTLRETKETGSERIADDEEEF